jgi:hypothetical protein
MRSWLGGMIDADPTLVGIVIVVVAVTALVYVVSRLRARSGGSG